jgi:acetoacetate decarboxylase
MHWIFLSVEESVYRFKHRLAGRMSVSASLAKPHALIDFVPCVGAFTKIFLEAF